MPDINILYSDFNCPFCYAMHERLYEMGCSMPHICLVQ